MDEALQAQTVYHRRLPAMHPLGVPAYSLRR